MARQTHNTWINAKSYFADEKLDYTAATDPLVIAPVRCIVPRKGQIFPKSGAWCEPSSCLPALSVGDSVLRETRLTFLRFRTDLFVFVAGQVESRIGAAMKRKARRHLFVRRHHDCPRICGCAAERTGRDCPWWWVLPFAGAVTNASRLGAASGYCR